MLTIGYATRDTCGIEARCPVLSAGIDWIIHAHKNNVGVSDTVDAFPDGFTYCA